MPDPDNPTPAPESSWVVRALLVVERIVKLVMPTLAVVAGGWAVYVGNKNHDRITQVQSQQTDAIEQTDKVRAALTSEQKKQQERQAEQNKTIAVNLRASWKYAEGVASDDPTPENQKAAQLARTVYDEFRKKNGINGEE